MPVECDDAQIKRCRKGAHEEPRSVQQDRGRLSLEGGVPVSRWVKWGGLHQAEEQHHVRQRYKGPWCDWETFKRPVALG